MKTIAVVTSIVGISLILSGCGNPSARREKLQPTLSENMLDNPGSTLVEDVALSGQITGSSPLEIQPESALTPEATAIDAEMSSAELPTAQNIQLALQNLGLYQGRIDGKIGPRTKQAIRDFQSRNDLRIDGKVGPQTWGKLSAYVKPVSPATQIVSTVSEYSD